MGSFDPCENSVKHAFFTHYIDKEAGAQSILPKVTHRDKVQAKGS